MSLNVFYVGITTGPALGVGTSIIASTVVTVVVDDIAGVEAGLLMVVEADLLVVIGAGNTNEFMHVMDIHATKP